MARRNDCSLPLVMACALFFFGGALPSTAAPPADQLLPSTTKSYVCVLDLDEFSERWSSTQFGKMVEDPVMKPFIQDLERQFKAKMSKTDMRIGISWADLKDVQSGEACVAMIQPWDAAGVQAKIEEAVERAVTKATSAGKSEQEIAAIAGATRSINEQEQEQARQTQCALAMVVDVAGNVEAAEELLLDARKDLAGKGATSSVTSLAGIEVVVNTIPVDEEKKTFRTAYHAIEQDMMIASDNEGIMTEILSRLSGDADGTLSQLPSYQATIAHCDKAFNDTQPQIKWFIEPFGLVEVMRAYAGGRKKRGTDILKVLGNQGFKAIQSVGGGVALMTDEHEVLQHTYVYAPPVARTGNDANPDKYDLAARMLRFPNTGNHRPANWFPRDVATYLSFNWKMKDAFWYAETLVNEFAGDEVFEDVLKSIETDPHGPMIDIENEFIQYLGERAMLIADCQEPITPKSERLLVALEVRDADRIMHTINKAMESDPQARKLEHEGHVIWELIKDEEIEVETVQIDGPGFGFSFEEEKEEEDKPFRPNAAVTVAHGKMIVASHVDYIIDMLDQAQDAANLESDGEFQVVSESLEKLGAGNDSFQFFTRCDEATRATYGLLRQGRMPESESLFGKVLNYIFEPDEEGEMREQYVDGSKLPEFQVVRRYLGPGGFFVRSEEDGWSISGVLLTKETK